MTADLAISPLAVHVAIDMQSLFADHPDWGIAEAARIARPIARLAELAKRRSLWSRFIPATTPEAASGCWQAYYRRWPRATLAAGAKIDLLPELQSLAAPENVFDKSVYSVFANPAFAARLTALKADSVILTGMETDVCVWATALDAVAQGYFVLLVADALASQDSAAHRAILDILAPRLSPQIGIAASAEILAQWRPA